ncbi:Glu/Leu/Phe/Val dehydrogenase [Patescibacteria group bacterium]|nr:Glu/Leu/Phe/Val dehydrogenase [Patescibacteria group bacterium]
MDLLDHTILGAFPEYDGHEAVYEYKNPEIGLHGYIALHNTTLGPANGGTRYWTYGTATDGLRDALALSRAMTYKCALAGVPYGGGKAVIIAPTSGKSQELFQTYAKRINELQGRFLTGQDVGLDAQDIATMQAESPFVMHAAAGNLGPWAARGVFAAIQATLTALFASDAVAGRTFAVKGLGNVGSELCSLLITHGGRVFAADTDPQKAAMMQQRYPSLTIVAPEKIHRIPVDIYAPCALGKELTRDRIHELDCKAVCGAANNQLADDTASEQLYERSILYVPDYVANAGGLINVVESFAADGYREERVTKRVHDIRQTTAHILEQANTERCSPHRIAEMLAQTIIAEKMFQKG